MTWLQISVDVTGDQADSVAEVFAAVDAMSGMMVLAQFTGAMSTDDK